MKTTLLAAILGIGLNVTTSHAQGYIIMENYKVVSGTPVFSAVTYTPGGAYVGAASGFKADLLFSLDGGATYSLAAGSQASFFPGSVDGGTPTTDGAGVFLGPSVIIPGYTAGSVNFIVEVYNGSSYNTSTSFGQKRGLSAVFTISSLQTNPVQPYGDILALSGTTPTGLQAFSLVPEPSIFALAGLCSAALMIVRRKK